MSDSAMIAVMGMGFSMFMSIIVVAIGFFMYNKGYFDDLFEKEESSSSDTTTSDSDTVSNPNTSNVSNVTMNDDKKTYFYNTTCTEGDKSYKLLSVHVQDKVPITMCKREENYSVWRPKKSSSSSTDYYLLYNEELKKYLTTNDSNAVMVSEKNGEYSDWIFTKQNSNSDHVSIQNRKTRRFLNIKDNSCKEIDKAGLQMIDISANAADAPDGCKWASLKFENGWGKAIAESKRC